MQMLIIIYVLSILLSKFVFRSNFPFFSKGYPERCAYSSK